MARSMHPGMLGERGDRMAENVSSSGRGDSLPHPDEQSDQALHQALLAGHHEALDLLFVRHRDALYRMLKGVTGDSGVAEDLVQETFLRLLRHTQAVAKVRPFLYRVAMNLAIDWQRKQGREVFGELNETRSLRDDLAPLEARDALERAMVALTDDQRWVIRLHYFADQPVRAVAEILRIPEGTVKTRLARAYQVLARELAIHQKRGAQARVPDGRERRL